MMIACMIDLWQLRSTSTTSPGRTQLWNTILFAVEVPLVTNRVRSAPKIRAACASASPTGPGVLEQRPELADRNGEVAAQCVLAEELVERRTHTAVFRNAVPPLCPGVCQE